MSDIILSCVIPVYNAAAHISGMAEMLSAQDAEGWEVIFVNDGSTDESGRMLDDIVSSGKIPARVIHQENAGVSVARNVGVDSAKGRFIAFLDVDDGISKDYMSVMKKYASDNHEVVIFRHSRVVEGDFRYDIPDGKAGRVSPEDVLNDFIVNPTQFGVYDLLLRADMLRNKEIRFPAGYPYYEDYDFIAKVFSDADDIVRAEECIYCYRAAAGSAMSTFNVKRIDSLELFESGKSRYMMKYPGIYEKFERWFASRIRWSIMWQACVSMSPTQAMAFARKYKMRETMKKLTGHPDRKVALSSGIYLVCPYIFIFVMAFMGKRRTLIAGRKKK